MSCSDICPEAGRVPPALEVASDTEALEDALCWWLDRQRDPAGALHEITRRVKARHMAAERDRIESASSPAPF